MSDPSGSSRLCIGDGDTQRMVGEEDNPSSYADEEISSYSFEDVPSRVDDVGVITSLKPVGEP